MVLQFFPSNLGRINLLILGEKRTTRTVQGVDLMTIFIASSGLNEKVIAGARISH